MEKAEMIKTPIGILSAYKNKIPEKCHCAEKPEISYISEKHIRIRTIDQTVSWGEEVFSPRFHQNCMDPENITLFDYISSYYFKNGFKWFLTEEEKNHVTEKNLDDYYDFDYKIRYISISSNTLFIKKS